MGRSYFNCCSPAPLLAFVLVVALAVAAEDSSQPSFYPTCDEKYTPESCAEFCGHDSLFQDETGSFTIPASITQEYELVQLQITIRHGAPVEFHYESIDHCPWLRNTTWSCDLHPLDPFLPGLASPTTENNGNCMFGQLLDWGAEQHKLNGRNLHAAYVSSGLLACSPGNMMGYHDAGAKLDFIRTKQSGDFIFNAMWNQRPGDTPPSTCCPPSDQKGCPEHPEVAECVSRFDPYCSKTMWDEQCAKEADMRCKKFCTQPRCEFTYSTSADNLWSLAWTGEDSMYPDNPVLNTSVPGIFALFPELPWGSYSCFETVMCNDAGESSIPKDQVDQVISEMVDAFFEYTSEQVQGIPRGSFLIADQIYAFYQCFQKGSLKPFVLWSSHDIFFFPFAVALGYKLQNWVPFAATFIIEHWQSRTSEDPDDAKVRFLFQGRNITPELAFCDGQELCPASAFQNYLKTLVDTMRDAGVVFRETGMCSAPINNLDIGNFT